MESFIDQDPTDIASGFIAQAATIDPVNTSHLYYISSSHLPRILLVNIDFDGNGFVGWKRGGLIALTAKNKAGNAASKLGKFERKNITQKLTWETVPQIYENFPENIIVAELYEEVAEQYDDYFLGIVL
ncbi:hypothetical protein HAX54_022981 [Datura stramonium]|uniref:Uncharacterized protein n=1 Tax=Datura stramonium TaxID=4076 RepID=A0ABS8UXN3_DATST|nr:hypothetical protein [Datura stramonium]